MRRIDSGSTICLLVFEGRFWMKLQRMDLELGRWPFIALCRDLDV